MKKKLHLQSADIPQGIITAIQYQKKDKLRASLFVDGKFAVGVNVSTIENFRLRKGDEMTSILAEKMCVYDNLVSAKRVAAKFINTRMRSEKEVRSALYGKENDTELINMTIESLKDIGLIDDKAFALAYIHDKLLMKPYSSDRLRSDLIKKGVSKEIIAEAFIESGIGESEEERTLHAAEKKWQQIVRRESDHKKRKQKLIAFLSSRGFAYDVIKRITSQLTGTDETLEDQ